MHLIQNEEYDFKMDIIFDYRTLKETFGAMVSYLLILYRTSLNERTTSAKQWFITITTKKQTNCKSTNNMYIFLLTSFNLQK